MGARQHCFYLDVCCWPWLYLSRRFASRGLSMPRTSRNSTRKQASARSIRRLQLRRPQGVAQLPDKTKRIEVVQMMQPVSRLLPAHTQELRLQRVQRYQRLQKCRLHRNWRESRIRNYRSEHVLVSVAIGRSLAKRRELRFRMCVDLNPRCVKRRVGG